MATNGLYTVWARCPIAAGNRVVAKGSMRVGWWQVRVEALKARPLSCYRCLEVGHVQSRCRSAVDRHNACYRCGQDGHRAMECVERPYCPVCAGAGRPSAHRVGGEACKSASESRRQISGGSRTTVRDDPPSTPREDLVPARPGTSKDGKDLVPVSEKKQISKGPRTTVRDDPPSTSREDLVPARPATPKDGLDPKGKDEDKEKKEEEDPMEVEDLPQPKDTDYVEDGTRWEEPDELGPSRPQEKE